jgi:hypothetical protein
MEVFMNWEAAGAVGEILGALAVLATIVYLARQVRDNSKQVKLNTTQSYASLVQDAYASVYSNDRTIRAWVVGNTTPELLEEEDLQLYFHLMDRQLNNAVPLINHYKEGAMSSEEFEHYKGFFTGLTSSVGGQLWMSNDANIMGYVIGKLRNV